MYKNGIKKRLCSNCNQLNSKSECKWLRYLGIKCGIDFAKEEAHPKCPLQYLTKQKLQKIATKNGFKSGWVFYTIKDLGLKKKQ